MKRRARLEAKKYAGSKKKQKNKKYAEKKYAKKICRKNMPGIEKKGNFSI